MKLLKDIDVNIIGKNVIVVEDIIDFGLIFYFLKDYFFMYKLKVFKFCILFDKLECRKVDLIVEYVGF